MSFQQVIASGLLVIAHCVLPGSSLVEIGILLDIYAKKFAKISASKQNKYFELKKLVGCQGAPEFKLLASNFPVYVQWFR